MKKKRTVSAETRMKMSLRAKERYAKKEPNSLSAAATVPQQQLTVALKLSGRIETLQREIAELEVLRDLATKYDLI